MVTLLMTWVALTTYTVYCDWMKDVVEGTLVDVIIGVTVGSVDVVVGTAVYGADDRPSDGNVVGSVVVVSLLGDAVGIDMIVGDIVVS